MQHPIQPDADTTRDVFEALMTTQRFSASQRLLWMRRWDDAVEVERARRAFDAAWTRAERGR